MAKTANMQTLRNDQRPNSLTFCQTWVSNAVKDLGVTEKWVSIIKYMYV